MIEDIKECENCGGIMGLVDSETSQIQIRKTVRKMYYRCTQCGSENVEKQRVV